MSLTTPQQPEAPKHGFGTRLGIYFGLHFQALGRSLGEIVRTPFSSLLTLLALAIALCLPALLYLAIQNMATTVGGWNKSAQISLFLYQDISEEQATALAEQLRKRPDIASLDYISSAMALEQFKRYSEYADVLDALGSNPLPITLVIQPRSPRPDAAMALHDELVSQPEVDRAQLDLAWLQRLNSLIDIGQQTLIFLSALFAAAVMLIVGNIVRLLMQQRREEIEIIKLFGGTHAFIRRPFLYRGMLHGLLGGLTAWGLVSLLVIQLQPDVAHLAKVYQSQLTLDFLYPEAIAALLLAPALLGWIAAYLTVGRYLLATRPR